MGRRKGRRPGLSGTTRSGIGDLTNGVYIGFEDPALIKKDGTRAPAEGGDTLGMHIELTEGLNEL